MRRFAFVILGLGALVVAGLAVGRARAQGPAWDPYWDYTRARAYRHFLNSPYRTRTYSSFTPGYVVGGITPYGYEQAWRGSGYLHQRISPRGFESYRVVPPRGGSVTVPGVVVPYPPLVPWGFPY